MPICIQIKLSNCNIHGTCGLNLNSETLQFKDDYEIISKYILSISSVIVLFLLYVIFLTMTNILCPKNNSFSFLPLLKY